MGVNSVNQQDLAALLAHNAARTFAPQRQNESETPANAPEKTRRQASAEEQLVQPAARLDVSTPAPETRSTRFTVDERNNRLVAQIVNENNEVVKQIPPEEMLKLASRLRRMEGLFFDERT